MNRPILEYGYPITAVILVVFGWVVYRRASGGWSEVGPLAVAAAIVWVFGAAAFIYFWPRLQGNTPHAAEPVASVEPDI